MQPDSNRAVLLKYMQKDLGQSAKGGAGDMDELKKQLLLEVAKYIKGENKRELDKRIS